MRCNQQYLWALIVTGSMFLSGCSAVSKGRADLDLGMKERGIASWYGADFHGWATANGELYDMQAFTAAHRTLPLGTVARVTNVVNGKHVMIRINDRGPYVNGRILDLSYAAANALNMVEDGVSAIQLEVVGPDRFSTEADQREQRTVGTLGVPYRLFETMPLASVPTMAKDQASHATAQIRPIDILRERRTRLVRDVMAAERCIEVVSELALV